MPADTKHEILEWLAGGAGLVVVLTFLLRPFHRLQSHHDKIRVLEEKAEILGTTHDAVLRLEERVTAMQASQKTAWARIDALQDTSRLLVGKVDEVIQRLPHNGVK